MNKINKNLLILCLIMSSGLQASTGGRRTSPTPPCPYEAVARPEDLESYPIQHRYTGIRTYLRKPLNEFTAVDFQGLLDEIQNLEAQRTTLTKDSQDRLITFKILLSRLTSQTGAQISAADAMEYESTAKTLDEELMELD